MKDSIFWVVLALSALAIAESSELFAEATLLQGWAEIKIIEKGSHSEHEAVVLKTENAFIQLRRKGTNPLQLDPELVKLVGKMVRCTGTLLPSSLLIVTSCDEIAKN